MSKKITRKSKHAKTAKAKPGSLHPACSARPHEYKAEFLWPHDDGTVEQAGYEFTNGGTEQYRKYWWDILLVRAKM